MKPAPLYISIPMILIALAVQAGCDSSGVAELEPEPMDDMETPCTPIEIDDNEFALRVVNSPNVDTTWVRMNVRAGPGTFFERERNAYDDQFRLNGAGAVECYRAYPLRYQIADEQVHRYRSLVLAVYTDLFVKTRQFDFDFEHAHYTYRLDLERIRIVWPKDLVLSRDAPHDSLTYVRMENRMSGTVTDFRAYSGSVRFASLGPGETTDYFEVYQSYFRPGDVYYVIGNDTLENGVDDFLGSPAPSGYYTLPLDTTNIFQFRDHGEFVRDDVDGVE